MVLESSLIVACNIHIRLDFWSGSVFFCWSSNSYCRIEVASHDSWYYYPCHNSQKLCCRCCRPQTIHSHTSVGCIVKMARKHNKWKKKTWCVFACELTNSDNFQKQKKIRALVSRRDIFSGLWWIWSSAVSAQYICSICINSPWNESPSLGKINGGRKMIPSFQRLSLLVSVSVYVWVNLLFSLNTAGYYINPYFWLQGMFWGAVPRLTIRNRLHFRCRTCRCFVSSTPTNDLLSNFNRRLSPPPSAPCVTWRFCCQRWVFWWKMPKPHNTPPNEP